MKFAADTLNSDIACKILIDIVKDSNDRIVGQFLRGNHLGCIQMCIDYLKNLKDL